MERLTKRSPAGVPEYNLPASCFFPDGKGDPIAISAFCQSAVDRLAAYEDAGLTPERCAELAEADKEGRLVVLPCRLGDTVFTIYQDCVMECSVEFVNMSKFAGGAVVLCRKGRCADRYGLPFSRFNSGTFATREEAEKALKEAKGDG